MVHFSWNKIQFTDIVIHFSLAVVAVITLYPFAYVIFASVSEPSSVAASPILLYPKGFTLQTYELLLSVSMVWQGYINSIIYTTAGTTLNVTVTIMAAYALSRPELKGRRVILFFIVLTLFFNGGMIPTFLVVRGLKLLNTRWAVIIPVAVATWNLLITRSYLETNIPQELHDAAQVDGASEFTFFKKIALPLSKPIIAVIMLFYATGHWNSYFNALIYLQDRKLYPLQIYLREILLLDQTGEMLGDMIAERALFTLTLKYAIMVVSILPLLVAFPFVQRYFVKGVLIGALKE